MLRMAGCRAWRNPEGFALLSCSKSTFSVSHVGASLVCRREEWGNPSISAHVLSQLDVAPRASCLRRLLAVSELVKPPWSSPAASATLPLLVLPSRWLSCSILPPPLPPSPCCLLLSRRPRLCPLSASFSSASDESSSRRLPRAVSRSRSLFADTLAACDTSDQVLQLLRASASPPAPNASPGRSCSPAVCPSTVMLLPEDCLAFLNALLRVQHVKRSGPDFIFFCDALENALSRLNATAEREQTEDREARERQHLERCLYASLQGCETKRRSREATSEARSKTSSLAFKDERRRGKTGAERGKFVRAVLLKLADLKAPLAFQRMTPYLEPHLPCLSAFDVAECLWAFATLQPPDWREKNGHLVRRLVERLLEPRGEAAARVGDENGGDLELRRKAKRPTASWSTTDAGGVSDARNASSGPSDRTPDLALYADSPKAGLALLHRGTQSLIQSGKQTKRGETEPSSSTGRDGGLLSADLLRQVPLEAPAEKKKGEQLLWVQADTRNGILGKGRQGVQSEAKSDDGVEGPLLLDSLSNLMVYRVTFGLAKLDFRCRLSQQVFQALAPKIRSALTSEESEAFPPRYLVRLAWSYARLRVRDVPLFAAFSRQLSEAVDELEYEELKVVKHVFEALEFWDRRLLGAVDELLRQLHELGPDESLHRPRTKPWKNRPRRVTLADPVVPSRKRP
ncbi:hypothetical protein TGRUB_213600 [Toxoplasma gondii RUB]|uniref:Uncharacterized protein n=1 Tax=Toxoplasma gondii RUB TaxID=935652 RepID=A0A086M2L4_TOXGO|nr:hypothetical protein TGRUB_213600 [Toxoplasma gondii RUB]